MSQPNPRPGVSELGLSTGKKARLPRILQQHGLGSGTAISCRMTRAWSMVRAIS